MFIYNLCSLILCLKIITAHGEIILQLSSGQISGKPIKTSRNTTGYIFLGIPYAEPPLGDLRFRSPLPIRKWEGVFPTWQFKPSCMWNSSETSNNPDQFEMSEDCLYINILTNERCLSKKDCAVIFYIHGGGFRYDTPSLFPIDFLIDNFLTMERSVVVALPAYRLGPFGFFNLAPSQQLSFDQNVGLLDLIEALSWTKLNINEFGGETKKITVMGHSSGGTIVDLFTLSPSTKGLFAQAIVMSGSNPLWLGNDENGDTSEKLIYLSGCARQPMDRRNRVELEKALACLRSIDAKSINLLQRKLEDMGHMFELPCLDGKGGVLPEKLPILRKKRHAPLLIGTTSEEFRKTSFLVTKNGEVDTEGLKNVCAITFKSIGVYNPQAVTDCITEYSDPIRAPHLVDDLKMFLPTYLSADDTIQAGYGVFLYEFEYKDVQKAYNIHKQRIDVHPLHSEELVYIMGIHQGNFTERDEIMRREFSQLFVNFARQGNPSSTSYYWEPLNITIGNYFSIDLMPNMSLRGPKINYHWRAIHFWNETILSSEIFQRESEKQSTILTYLTNSLKPRRLKKYILVSSLLVLFAIVYFFLSSRTSKRKRYEKLYGEP